MNVVAGVIVPPLFLAASFFGATTDASPTLIAHEYSTFNRLIAGGGNREATDSPAEPLENTEDVTKNDISRSLNYIHETSGLTWEEIAYLLGVSRRAVHNWINGSRVSSKNARNLAGLHRLIQKVDQGDRESTRAHLLAPRDNGTTLYEAAMVAGRADRSHLDLALDPVTRIAVADD